jgi:hypothetical protein
MEAVRGFLFLRERFILLEGSWVLVPPPSETKYCVSVEEVRSGVLRQGHKNFNFLS